VRLEREGRILVYFAVAGPDGVLRHARRQLPHRLPGSLISIGLALSAHNNIGHPRPPPF
jgi:hypothetical protein